MHPDDLFDDSPPLLSVKEIAELWRVNRITIIRLIDSGELEAFKAGRSWRVSRDSAKAYMEAQRARPGQVLDDIDDDD